MTSGPSLITAEQDVGDAIEALYARGVTDGLPVVPPTRRLVERAVAASGRDGGELIALVPPNYGRATVEKIAINAVMAGCRPEYLPVVLAAVDAICDEKFDLHGVSATTNAPAPLVLVNGPIRAELEINSGAGVFGPGWRANATIGRALRLVMRNLGGAKPDGMEKSTQAWPGKAVGCCFAENEARSPWEPFHVSRGYAREASVVHVVATRGIYPVTEGTQTTGQGVIETLVAAMRYLGTPIFHQMRNRLPLIVALCPEHAQEIAKAGFGREQLRDLLYAEVRLPVRDLIGRVYYGARAWPEWVDESDPETRVPIVATPDDIWLVVAGGDGRHSAWMPAWGVCQGATEVIEEI